MSSASTICAWLIPQPGAPAIDPLELQPASARGQGLVLGRHQNCDLRLPSKAERVSRAHAQFMTHAGKWSVIDLGSRWGTQVNGVQIEPRRPTPLNEGDLIRIQPWTFRFSVRGMPDTGPVSVDDVGTTIIRTTSDQPSEKLRHDLLNLLLEGSAALHAAGDLETIAKILVDLACRGTRLPRSAVLQAVDDRGHIQIIHSNVPPGAGPEMAFSRSLLAAAAAGAVGEISSEGGMDVTQSIARSNVSAAICAPLIVGGTVAAYLYLDSQSPGGGALEQLSPNASGFCQALGRMGGLALANIKRIEMQINAAAMERDLATAADAQRWILPKCPIQVGPFSFDGHCRPSAYIGGDFFDAQILPDGRLVVSLGDVCGHGIAASVLMSATQGFLRAALSAHSNLPRAVSELSAFVHCRSPRTQYLTLWIGVLDPREMTVSYVDAGHGLALLIDEGQQVGRLASIGGLPVGIEAEYNYSMGVAHLPPLGRLLIVSDGIVEQSDGLALEQGERRRFGIERIESAVQNAEHDLIPFLFNELQQFAGGQQFTDDATAVLLQWK
jgi:phosphoserine phosphatase RsbU/P